MTHIFSTGINQMRHVTHLAQKYDISERRELPPGVTGFLAVRLSAAEGSPPPNLYKFPVGNSPAAPRRFEIRSP